MKITSLLLSFFFVLLVTIPCNDAVSFSSNSSVTVKKSDTSHQSDRDDCSVFCNCSCCGFVTVSEKIHFQLEEKINFSKIDKISDFQNDQLLTRPSGIWQPPKLG